MIAWFRHRVAVRDGRGDPLFDDDTRLTCCFLGIVAVGAAAFEVGDVGDLATVGSAAVGSAAVGFMPEDVDVIMRGHCSSSVRP